MAALPADTRLTPALYEAFLGYKKATTTIERWLARAIGKADGEARLTISQMEQAAIYIDTMRIELPIYVYHAFDEAITARSKVTSHFKKAFKTAEVEAKTASHQHFTNKLKAIFESLCQNIKPVSKTTTSIPPHARDILLSNRFSTLAEERAPASPAIFEENPLQDTCRDTQEQRLDEIPTKGIQDDEVVQDFDLHFAFWDLETTCDKVKDYWTKAAIGSMPFMVAAFLTLGAMSNANRRYIGHAPLSEIWDLLDEEGLLPKVELSGHRAVGLSQHSNAAAMSTLIRSIKAPLVAVILDRYDQESAQQYPGNPTEKSDRNIPSLTTQSKLKQGLGGEVSILRSILRTIREIPEQGDQDTFEKKYNLVMSLRPAIPSFESVPEDDPSIPTRAVFILRMILDSFTSWSTTTNGASIELNSRILTLRFAQDVQKSLERFRLSGSFESKDNVHCRCCGYADYSESLRQLEKDLRNCISEKRFDLYHQSPAVAGFQMMKILARATSIGLMFCNQYVGVVLHLYNALRQFEMIEEETVLLEHLCNVIGHNVFRGPRPKVNYFSQYAAFQGAALEFDKKSRKWRIGFSHTQKRHLFPHGLSVMTGLNDCNFLPLCYNWVHVWSGVDRYSNFSDAVVDKTVNQMSAHPLVCVLEPLETCARRDWEGECPVARINWFEVVLACTQILENLSTAFCDDPRVLTARHVHESREMHFLCGKRHVETFLSCMDENSKISSGIENIAGLDVAIEAIREVMSSKRTADFLWGL